jgi:hypothetical protein
MHSFRHMFATAMRRAGLTPDVRKALGGWKRSDSSGSQYGEFPIEVLHSAISKVTYPGLNLTHLHTP